MQKKKMRREILVLISSILFISVGFTGGIAFKQYQYDKESEKSTVDTIAVVNLDNGTMVEGKRINYASELISFPDMNFSITSLEDARQGVTDSRYAAYIVIPSDFSESAVSINTKPSKAGLEYAMGTNLREDIKVKAVHDVHNFILNLNTNISYMYVDAVLKEFHAAQDSAVTIMENDTKDMEMLSAVDSEELIQNLEFSEMEQVENTLQPLDLSDNYEAAKTAADNITKDYQTALDKAETELETIAENRDAVMKATSTVTDSLGAVDILTDADGNKILEAGEAELNSLTADYDEQFEIQKNKIKMMLGWQPAAGDKVPVDDAGNPIQYDGLQTVIDNKTDAVTAAIEKYNSSLEEKLQNVSDKLDELEAGTAGCGDVRSELNKITSINIAKTDIDISAEMKRIIAETEDIPEINSKEAAAIIQEGYITPLTAECKAESDRLTTQAKAAEEKIDAYITSIEEYNPLGYIDYAAISTYFTTLSTTVTGIQKEVSESNSSYVNYANDVYMAANNNISSLKEDMQTAYKNTVTNINTVMEAQKTSRSTINTKNITLLEDLTKKLPYTRIGSLEYTQVYDFIVNPVTVENKSVVQPVVQEQNEGYDRMLGNILFFAFTALIIIWIVRLAVSLRRGDYQVEEDYEINHE